MSSPGTTTTRFLRSAYDAAGVPLGTEIAVSDWSAESQLVPVVAIGNNGDFVVVWQRYQVDGSTWGILARRFRSDGTAKGDAFPVNTFTAGNQGRAEIAMDATGNFVIVWQSEGQDEFGNGVFARRYGSDGMPSGAEFQVNAVGSAHEWGPSVAMHAHGTFVVSWISDALGNGGDARVMIRQFAADGTPLTGDIEVTSGAGRAYAINPYGRLGMDDEGNFVVVWLADQAAPVASNVYAPLLFHGRATGTGLSCQHGSGHGPRFSAGVGGNAG